MGYRDWFIGTDEVPWVESVTPDHNNYMITLHCAAWVENDIDPREEVDYFLNLKAPTVTVNKINGGGTKLFTGGMDLITFGETGKTSYRGVIKEVKAPEGDLSDQLIQYDIVLVYEVPPGTAPLALEPPYSVNNIITEYYGYSDKTNPPGETSGTEIGYMKLEFDTPVTRIVVHGSACNCPAWLKVNGEQQNWHCSHDHNEGDTGEQCVEPLEYVLNPPTAIVELQTSIHLWGTSVDVNKGCWPQLIEVFS